MITEVPEERSAVRKFLVYLTAWLAQQQHNTGVESDVCAGFWFENYGMGRVGAESLGVELVRTAHVAMNMSKLIVVGLCRLLQGFEAL